MVCVAVKGTPIIGVIHKPFEREPQTFWAWEGKGSSDNLKKKKVYEKLKLFHVSSLGCDLLPYNNIWMEKPISSENFIPNCW
jgi:Archaeal fructose-1,6-bisphosphatase and related enzymes of inositol monophosphatase family